MWWRIFVVDYKRLGTQPMPLDFLYGKWIMKQKWKWKRDSIQVNDKTTNVPLWFRENTDTFNCFVFFLITAQPLNIRMNLSQLYGSSTAGRIVCRSVCKIASTRFLICRDLLILQQLLMRLGDAVSTTWGKPCNIWNLFLTYRHIAECQLWEHGDFCLCSLLYPPCLALSRYSINTCWIKNE